MFQPLTIVPGFDFWPGLLDVPAQRKLVDAVMAAKLKPLMASTRNLVSPLAHA